MTATALLSRVHEAAPEEHRSADAGSGDDFMRALYENYKPQLEAYVFRLTRDAHWAEDIVQAALIRAWRARQSLTEDDAATRSWLFTVAYRIFIDEYRARSRRPVTMTGQDIAKPGPGHDDADRLAWSVTLAQAMAALSEAHRQAIMHVYYQSRTADEAASLLGISPGTVKSRVHYALLALRKELAPTLRIIGVGPPPRATSPATAT
jgi:RNA polymerase sigma-70 factor (ECF subfamily)